MTFEMPKAIPRLHLRVKSSQAKRLVAVAWLEKLTPQELLDKTIETMLVRLERKHEVR